MKSRMWAFTYPWMELFKEVFKPLVKNNLNN